VSFALYLTCHLQRPIVLFLFVHRLPAYCTLCLCVSFYVLCSICKEMLGQHMFVEWIKAHDWVIKIDLLAWRWRRTYGALAMFGKVAQFNALAFELLQWAEENWCDQVRIVDMKFSLTGGEEIGNERRRAGISFLVSYYTWATFRLLHTRYKHHLLKCLSMRDYLQAVTHMGE
jgi:hypothetical protein